MKRSAATLIVLLAVLALIAPRVPAQTRPRLADYFTEIPDTVLDARFVSDYAVRSEFEDLDGDGNASMSTWTGYRTWSP